MSRSRAARTAVRNAWALTLGDGIEQPQRTPSTVVYDAPHRTLRRYDRDTPATGNPVLLVPPLAVSAHCYDLRPGQSLVAHLIELGLQPYVIDYGDITFADRRMGFEEWTADILPNAVEEVSRLHRGAMVDLVAWSLGGTISFLTAASNPGLPIGSITAIGTPIDYLAIPGPALAHRVGRVTGGRLLALPPTLMGGVPRHLVRASFRATAIQREVTKPLYILRNLTDTEALARMESVDRFMDEMPGYPGRLYLQIYARLVQRLELVKGVVRLSDDHVIELDKVTQRLLVIGSSTDAIAPAPAVKAAVDAFPGAESIEYVEVQGSHLGMVAGVEARTTTWPVIARFLQR